MNNLSGNAILLINLVATTLSKKDLHSEDDVFNLANQLRQIDMYSVSDEEFENVIKEIHAQLRINMRKGDKVVDDSTQQPWLQARKPQIDPFYWNRYQQFLISEGIPPRVANVTLDEVTDEILDLIGDPQVNTDWARKGLVMGSVQSGKTSTYTGLICKAADAGYRLIIVLTGTLESLRQQTQKRLDEGFVGRDSKTLMDRHIRNGRNIGVGLLDSRRSAGVFTSSEQDFKTITMNQLGITLDSIKEPVLLVVKKNKRILENLTKWLKSNNALRDGRINLPMLLIDDEADNASVNTNPEAVTAINEGIRSLLRTFPRSSYIGFTATPFANIFIHPDTVENMLGDDLFPRDFIYALSPPSNYVSVDKIFGDEPLFDCLLDNSDASDFFPLGHKSNLEVEELPESLLEAIRCFFIVNAIKDTRANVTRHRSMLVNVSHYTDVQEKVRHLITEYVKGIQSDVRNYSNLKSDEALKNSTIKSLFETFEKQYKTSGLDWSEIQKKLINSTLPIEVRSINQKSTTKLDFDLYKENGLRVIVVGGNSLSRGLTLEGLSISYYHRSTQMYDSLLQMGRWFGYRKNYEDLFKIYLNEEVKNWYSHISDAVDELWREIRNMQKLRKRPIDFGLKVRSHPNSLLITARNKMRYTEEIVHLASMAQRSVETPWLPLDKHQIEVNAKAGVDLIKELPKIKPSNKLLWTNIDKKFVSNFLKDFKPHFLNLDFQSEALANFIENSNDNTLDLWDIVVPSGSENDIELIPGFSHKFQKRLLKIDKDLNRILINGEKMRVGSQGVEKEGLTDTQIEAAIHWFRSDPENENKKNIPDYAFRRFRSRPLLMLHFIKGYEAKGKSCSITENMTLLAVGISFPHLKEETLGIKYRINLVELRNLLAHESIEDEEDYESID